MGNDLPSDGGLCFDAYHVDLRTGELRKHGRKIRLAGRPFQILALLLERPGELLTRKELQERLWSADTFVDFEHGVNAAIQTLRRALCDSHKNPRFIETLPRRGYRFIVAVEGAQVGAGPGGAPAERRQQPAAAASVAASGAARSDRTLPRRGYRFIVAVEGAQVGAGPGGAPAERRQQPAAAASVAASGAAR